ncbi:hypothetical protein V6N13_134459 [Hibiscus sabdariffa]
MELIGTCCLVGLFGTYGSKGTASFFYANFVESEPVLQRNRRQASETSHALLSSRQGRRAIDQQGDEGEGQADTDGGRRLDDDRATCGAVIRSESGYWLL